MSDDIYIDVNYLTESERDTILQVLSKDEELRKQEKKRISKLKTELDEIKKRGASEEEIRSSRICARCRSPLGLVFNSGALCRKCETRVCKGCRKEYSTSSWLCVLCAKIREVRAESGAWFFEEERRRGDRPQLYGSALVRASFRRAKPASLPRKAVVKDVEPSSPPVITLSLENGGRKLHRPVPVHMSRLVEKETEEEEEAKSEEAEVNQNYKQYVKANPIPQKEDEEPSERHKKDSSASSHSSSTSRGSPVHDLGNDAVESVHEETVFDHLVNQQNTRDEASEEMFEDKSDDTPQYNNTNGHIEDELQHYEEKINKWEIEREKSEFTSEEKVSKWEIETEENEYTSEEKVNKWEIEREESEFASEEKVNKWEIETEESGQRSEDRKPEAAIEIKTTWHEVAHEWANTGDMNEQPLQDTYPPKVLLDVRPASPDSETTGEFFTPLVTPLHSQTGTPALSEENLTSGSEVYEDAGQATPVKGNTTPVVKLSAQDDEGKIGDVTIANPEITCSTFSDDGAEPQDGHKTPTQEDEMEDIDQAFASYERDHPDMGKQRTLQEQLNIISMGSRESIVSYYSDAGEGRFGNIPVTGEVLFGLKYDKHKYQLEVQIHRAKGIAAADEKRRKSDPYVKVYLLPDKTRGGKRKTKVKKNTLDPDFDEILKFKIGYDEMLTRTLWLAMWNHDTFGHNDFLGEVMLPLDTYQESGFTWEDPSPNWYPLQERRPQPSLMSYCGDLTVSLMFEPGDESNKDKKKKKKSKGKLHVQLKEARNLPAKDANGFSDPFAKSYLLPDTSKKTKRKTSVIKRNLNPIWNHSFAYDNLTIDELRNRVLELTVWDYDRGSSNDFLGGLRLGLGNNTEPWEDSQGLEIEAWRLMLERPNKWHEHTLNLRSSMDSQVD